MKRMAIVVLFLTALVASVFLVARLGASGGTSQAQGPVIVGFDMDTTGNSCPFDGTNCTLGNIDRSVDVPSGGGVIEFDVFLEDLPGSESILGWGAQIGGWPGTLTGQVCEVGTVNLPAQPGSNMLVPPCGELVPDSTPPHSAAVSDLGAAEFNPPYTHGTLGRYTLDTTGVADGVYGLTLSNVLAGNDGANDLCLLYGCQIRDANSRPVYGMIRVGQPVGGIAELADASGSSAPNYIALAGLAAVAVVVLTAGAWYVRRRWVR